MTDPASDLHELCDALETTLLGPTRSAIVDGVTAAGGGLGRLRTALQAQSFHAGDRRVDFQHLVRKLDQRTRREGFRVLHSWDHTSHRFSDDITPVLMLDYIGRAEADGADLRTACAILLDYDLLHLLALCAMRAWDASDPDAVLDRATSLVGALQGPHGSGHHFVTDAETLIIYALSQFHPEEQAYDRLIEKVTRLRPSRQLRFARESASVLSSHLRWGFWLMYERDVLRMRSDNEGDYPWLLNSAVTLMREYAALVGDGVDRNEEGPHDVVEGVLHCLAADPWVFTGKAPSALAEYQDEHAEMQGLLRRHGGELLADLDRHEPSKEAYAPLALHYNFPHNTLVAMVATSLMSGVPSQLAINALFRGAPADDVAPDRDPAVLARALTAFSGASPDRLGFQGAILVAYDPLSALRTFSMTRKALAELLDTG